MNDDLPSRANPTKNSFTMLKGCVPRFIWRKNSRTAVSLSTPCLARDTTHGGGMCIRCTS